MELVKGLQVGPASHRLARVRDATALSCATTLTHRARRVSEQSESGFWELCDAEAAGWQELAAAVLAPPTDSEGEEPTPVPNTDTNTASGARSDSSLDKPGDGCVCARARGVRRQAESTF